MHVKQLRWFGALLCFLALFQLFRRGVSGPAGATLFYGTLAIGSICFIIGEAIALRDWFRGRSGGAPDPAEPNGVGESEPRPSWTGDPAGNRRRLKIIIVVFVLLGMIAAIYMWMR